MTSECLRGLPLETALAILLEKGIIPEIAYSEPPGGYRDMSGRTARVVRYEDGLILCSHFRDAMPEVQ